MYDVDDFLIDLNFGIVVVLTMLICGVLLIYHIIAGHYLPALHGMVQWLGNRRNFQHNS